MKDDLNDAADDLERWNGEPPVCSEIGWRSRLRRRGRHYGTKKASWPFAGLEGRDGETRSRA
jgi:hypothetical protein